MRGGVLATEVVLRICVTVCKFVLEFALTLEILRSGVVNLYNCLQLCVRICAHAEDLAIWCCEFT